MTAGETMEGLSVFEKLGSGATLTARIQNNSAQLLQDFPEFWAKRSPGSPIIADEKHISACLAAIDPDRSSFSMPMRAAMIEIAKDASSPSRALVTRLFELDQILGDEPADSSPGRIWKRSVADAEKIFSEGEMDKPRRLWPTLQPPVLALANIISPLDLDLDRRLQEIFIEVKEQVFADCQGELDAEVAVETVSNEWMQIGREKLDGGHFGPAALVLVAAPKTVWVNAEIDDMDIDPDTDQKLRYLITHETVHTTQNKDYIKSGLSSRVRNDFMEGVTEAETWLRLRRAGYRTNLENGMNQLNSNAYLGFQFALHEAFSRDPKTKNPNLRCFRRLLEGDVQANVKEVADLLFPKSSSSLASLEKFYEICRERHLELGACNSEPTKVCAWVRSRVAEIAASESG